MNSDYQTLLGLAARHALTTLAGILITHGYLQAGGTEQFVGACTLILGIGWSWWQKKGQAAVAAELAALRSVRRTGAVDIGQAQTKKSA